MIFHENGLPADDSHETSCHICYFEKKTATFENCRLLQIIGVALRVKDVKPREISNIAQVLDFQCISDRKIELSVWLT